MKYNAPSGSTDSNASYVTGNAVTKVKGSAVPAEAVEYDQREIVNVIEFAGIDPSNNDLSQLRKAIVKIITDNGAGAATLTKLGLGRIATLADALPNSTIENEPAFLSADTFKISQTPDANVIPMTGSTKTLDEWITQFGIAGASSNIKGSATGTNANIACTVDEIVVKNSSNKYQTLRNLSLSAATTSAGAGGLDVNTATVSTWYYVFVIYNPTTSTPALLLSLSRTAPTLPSGYTYWARVGTIRTDSTNKYPLRFNQFDRKFQYAPAAGTNVTEYPIIASGALGTWTSSAYTPVATSVSAFVPPSASAIKFLMYNGGAGVAMAAGMNGTGGGWGSSTTPPFQNLCANSAILAMVCEGVLESTNIHLATASAGPTYRCIGWEDNL